MSLLLFCYSEPKEEGEDDGESPATGEATAEETAPPIVPSGVVVGDEPGEKGDDSAVATSVEVVEVVAQEVIEDADKPEVTTTNTSEVLLAEGVEEPSSEVAPAVEDAGSQPTAQDAEGSSAVTVGESKFNYPDAEEGEEVEPHLHAPQSLGAQAQNQPAYAIVMVEKPGGGVRAQYIPLHDR